MNIYKLSTMNKVLSQVLYLTESLQQPCDIDKTGNISIL